MMLLCLTLINNYLSEWQVAKLKRREQELACLTKIEI